MLKLPPVHKGDDKRLINNYRPIFILPVFSKVLEKLIHFRLTPFFIDMCNLICDNQYGFRAKHTAYIALLNIMDEISVEIDNRKYSTGIFLDFSKAFDTIDFYTKCSNIGVASQNMYILIMPSEMIMYKPICDKIIMEYRR